jgi:hypothetical protein
VLCGSGYNVIEINNRRFEPFLVPTTPLVSPSWPPRAV